MKLVPYFLLLSSIFTSMSAFSIDVLKPVKTDSPRATMRTFLHAMNSYREAVEGNDDDAQKQNIDRAVRTLMLEQHSTLLRYEMGRKAAIHLKEVMDRVIVIDLNKIPNGVNSEGFNGKYWRLKDTEIAIRLVESGDRSGEYLFSADTVDRSKDFYDAVKSYPYLKGAGQGAGYKETVLTNYMPKILQGEIFGVAKWQIVGVFAAIVFGFFFKFLTEGLLGLGQRIASRSKSQWDDQILKAVEGPIGYCVASGFWFLSLYMLRLDGAILQVLTVLVQFIFSVSLIWVFYRMADVWTQYLAKIAKKTDLAIDDQLVPLFSRALRTFILVLGGLIAIQNLGVNVMSVVAGLGLGGLAFALAAKDTAANLFGSLMILWDRPFRIGDWIKFENVEGTVEDVGFRSTRVRTFYNSIVTVPNAVVANHNIDNMGKRRYRRLKTYLGLTYDTPPEKMEAFLEGVRNILRANPKVWQDNFHVVFNQYSSSSLDILLYCFLEVKDWGEELVQRQNIFLEIMRLAQHLGVDFAFPTQSLHVESFPEKSGLERHKEGWDNTGLMTKAGEFAKGGAQSQPLGLGIYKQET